jgi:hypothetical protein
MPLFISPFLVEVPVVIEGSPEPLHNQWSMARKSEAVTGIQLSQRILDLSNKDWLPWQFHARNSTGCHPTFHEKYVNGSVEMQLSLRFTRETWPVFK